MTQMAPRQHCSPLRRGRRAGFTLMELLITMAIIAVLSIVVFESVREANLRAREASARAEIKSLHTAIVQLANDTGKWPFGCLIGSTAGLEMALGDVQSGLVSAPAPGATGPCTWAASDVAGWSGAYIPDVELDPWGNAYYLDTDYHPYENCPTIPTLGITPAIVSFGSNGLGVNAYDCDDIFLALPAI